MRQDEGARARNRSISRAYYCAYVARRNVIVDAAWADARGIRPAPGESAGAYDRRVQAFVAGRIEAGLRAARWAYHSADGRRTSKPARSGPAAVARAGT